MYHFDYLTLLLAGALDAQAVVAHRAYEVGKPPESKAGFRKTWLGCCRCPDRLGG
jgi:hypothetical protein